MQFGYCGGASVSIAIQDFSVTGTPTDVLDIERLSCHAYSLIGREYYDSTHITCRNFDAVVNVYLNDHPIILEQGRRYIEVGCGRSRLSRYSDRGAQIVLVDISAQMLSHSFDDPSFSAFGVLGSAFRLPFRANAFESAFAFLADPYLHPNYITELNRIVRPGGRVVQVVPAHEWGSTLRAFRQSPAHFSHFFRGDREAFGPSFLLPKQELINLLAVGGFRNIEVTDLFLPDSVDVESVSPDITTPAAIRGVSPYDLPILSVVEAVAI